jgi:tryptophanyl-tRNA synthetase
MADPAPTTTPTADPATTPSTDAPVEDGSSSQHIDPWTVQGGKDGIDYNKLIKDFGSQPIDEALIQRVERVTGKPAHPWLKRGYFFSHRFGPSFRQKIYLAEFM